MLSTTSGRMRIMWLIIHPQKQHRVPVGLNDVLKIIHKSVKIATPGIAARIAKLKKIGADVPNYISQTIRMMLSGIDAAALPMAKLRQQLCNGCCIFILLYFSNPD
jgi:hypothetical protein